MTRREPEAPAAPPRIAERLVRLAAGRDRWRDVVTGDLREEFESRLASRGRGAATRWYYRQSLAFVAVQLARAAGGALGWLPRLVTPEGDHLVRTLGREVRLAVRTVVRQPLVSFVVILTLALGLGSNAATFGMIESLLLRPFPFDHVDRLVVLSENSATDPYPRESVAPANYLDLRAQAGTLDGVAAFRWWDVNFAGADQPEFLLGFRVTADFFRVLGVQPAHGRVLGDPDIVFGRHRQVVLSDALWRRRFAGDPAVLGRPVTLDGEPYVVVGIAPAGFDFPSGAELWAALAFDATAAAERATTSLTVIGRLRDGVSRERTNAELGAIYTRIQAEHAEATRSRRLVVRTFTDGMIDPGMPEVLLLWQAAAVFVLLIGCTNLANLLLARGAARQRELAVRLAIGAGRGRLIRQLLMESAVLSVAALPVALGVAAVTFQVCRAAMPPGLVRFIPGWNEMGVDLTLVAFTLAAAAVTSVIVGLLPAIRASRPALTGALRDGGRSVSGALARSRLRRGLVVAELALALPLLIASGLSALAAHRFASGPQGYDPDGLFRAATVLPDATYPDAASRRQFTERLLEAARRQPGVADAATASVLPASGTNSVRALAIEGRAEPDQPVVISYRAVSPNYLALLRIPIQEGRGLTDHDRADSEPVVVLTRSAAERHWPGASPIGRRVRLGANHRPWATVVGIAGDTIDEWYDRRRVPTAYVPVAQAPNAVVNLVLRTSGDPAALAGAARAAAAAVDPRQPQSNAMTMAAALHLRTTGLRFVGGLMAVFGALALVLAAVGIYSVMAYHVAQRRQEMGIRMALGATGGDLLRLTVGQGARMAALGVGLGLVAAIALSRVLERALFGVVSLEPWLFASVAGTLGAVALLACLIPARQASAVDPVIALRQE